MSEPGGVVFNIMRYSTQDGPGLRTTVFLKGCPLECAWCHNPESQTLGREVIFRPERCLGCGECVEACPQAAIVPGPEGLVTRSEDCLGCGVCAEVCPAEAREAVGETMSVAGVMAEIIKDRAFYEESGGGVTFSGGEPLAQPEFLAELLAACRVEEVPTAVDTSGAAPWEVFDRIRSEVDLFLYDLKLMDDSRHRRYTGASNRPILDNLRRLALAGERVLVRVPVIPGVNDDEDNLDRLGLFVAGLPGVNEIKLLPYHDTGRDKYRLLGRPGEPFQARTPEVRELENIAARLKRLGVTVYV